MAERSLLKKVITQIFLPRIYQYKKVGWSWVDELKIKKYKAERENKYRLFNSYIFFRNYIDLLYSIREIFVEEIYKVSLPNQPLIFDCGANMGISVLYFKKHFPSAKVVAFEPDTQSFQILSKNIKSFNLQDVELHNEAVWIADTYLNFTNDSTLSSRINESTSDRNSYTKIKAVRLADLLIHPVDFLKIDIEGAEYRVLKDIEAKLHLIQNLFLEYHGSFKQNDELLEIFTILRRNSFYFYIREATPVYPTPFHRAKQSPPYDVQLNIFCFKKL